MFVKLVSFFLEVKSKMSKLNILYKDMPDDKLEFAQKTILENFEKFF